MIPVPTSGTSLTRFGLSHKLTESTQLKVDVEIRLYSRLDFWGNPRLRLIDYISRGV